MEINKNYLIGGGVLVGALILLSSRGGGGGGGAAATVQGFNNAAILSNLETNKMVAAAQPVNVKTSADLMAKLSDNRLATFNSQSNLFLSALDMNNQTTAINSAALDKLRERSQVMPLARLTASSDNSLAVEKARGDTAIELAKINGANITAQNAVATYNGRPYAEMNDWEKNMQAAIALNNSNNGYNQSGGNSGGWINSAISTVGSLISAYLGRPSTV